MDVRSWHTAGAMGRPGIGMWVNGGGGGVRVGAGAAGQLVLTGHVVTDAVAFKRAQLY